MGSPSLILALPDQLPVSTKWREVWARRSAGSCSLTLPSIMWGPRTRSSSKFPASNSLLASASPDSCERTFHSMQVKQEKHYLAIQASNRALPAFSWTVTASVPFKQFSLQVTRRATCPSWTFEMVHLSPETLLQ